MSYEKFDWGPTYKEYIDLFTEENFTGRTYERFYKINEDDVVVDIGANVGSFVYSLINSKPKHVFCLEPSNTVFKTLQKNLDTFSCTLINKGISNVNSDYNVINPNSDYIYHHIGSMFSTITFDTFIKNYGIEKIDFLKFDCEGGEAFIFTKENSDMIKRIVKNIAGEYHICGVPNSVKNFIEFRDNYLSSLRGTDKLHVYERDGKDVTEQIFDNNFLYAYEEWWRINNPYKGQFIVYANLKGI
jgi:FkbM family methyltransferase